MSVYSLKEIESIIPHRFENLLIDEVTVLEPGEKGVFSLAISEQDALNRSIFFKSLSPTKQVLISPFFMEILALASCVSQGRLSESSYFLFAGISNYEKTADFELGSRIQGEVFKLSDRKGFLKCGGCIYDTNQQKICSGDMTAFIVDGLLPPESRSGEIVVPEQNCQYPVQKNPALKHEMLYAVDEWIFQSEDRLVFKYSYPHSHPFVKGHFPGNPLMMGVMQWMSVEDALFLFSSTVDRSETPYLIEGDAVICNQFGESVAQIKGFSVRIHRDVPGLTDHAELVRTQKVTFRTMVRPSDCLYITISSFRILNS